jgi:hypothetical protein
MALIEFNGGEYQELEDAKTLKAVMFLMIQEHVKSIPNDQELGARIRQIILKFNKENNENN